MAAKKTPPLAEKIKRLLAERGWTQARLSQASGLDATVLSRLLAGERHWRTDHVACVAAALGLPAEELADGTDAAELAGGATVDANFVATLTLAHATLGAENARLLGEIDAAKAAAAAAEKRKKQFAADFDRAEREVTRERRARELAESARATAVEAETRLQRELSHLRTELAAEKARVAQLTHQLTAAQGAHATAVATANRNYVVVKDLETQLAKAKGVAVTGGILGLAALIKMANE